MYLGVEGGSIVISIVEIGMTTSVVSLWVPSLIFLLVPANGILGSAYLTPGDIYSVFPGDFYVCSGGVFVGSTISVTNKIRLKC